MLIWVITGAILQLCFVSMAVLGDLRQHTIGFLALFGVACIAYGWAVWWSLRQAGDRKTLMLIAGSAVLFRMTCG